MPIERLARPRCRRCGYDIFGVRDLRCPACGTALDVRDFNSDGPDTRAELRRYERNTALAAGIGVLILAGLLTPIAVILWALSRYGVASPHLTLLAVIMIIWMAGLAMFACRSAAAWLRSRRHGPGAGSDAFDKDQRRQPRP